MITKENFAGLMATLDRPTLEAVADGSFHTKDYVLMEVMAFNAGAVATLESVDYDEVVMRGAEADGSLFCTPEDFTRLCGETGALGILTT